MGYRGQVCSSLKLERFQSDLNRDLAFRHPLDP